MCRRLGEGEFTAGIAWLLTAHCLSYAHTQKCNRRWERQTDRQTETHRERQRDRDRHRQRETQTETDRDRETETDTDRERQRQADTETQTQTETDRETETHRKYKIVSPFYPIIIVQELCESRGGRPGLSVLTSLLVSVDVKNY